MTRAPKTHAQASLVPSEHHITEFHAWVSGHA